jgi:hypothetical protein
MKATECPLLQWLQQTYQFELTDEGICAPSLGALKPSVANYVSELLTRDAENKAKPYVYREGSRTSVYAHGSRGLQSVGHAGAPSVVLAPQSHRNAL